MPSDAELQPLFLKIPDPPEGTFEFALVLGGTVSAGAYTAGAVGFLIEAMDCLAAAQQRGEAPQHKVVLDCQVAEHCWDPVGHAIVTYGYLFDRLIQARPREV